RRSPGARGPGPGVRGPGPGPAARRGAGPARPSRSAVVGAWESPRCGAGTSPAPRSVLGMMAGAVPAVARAPPIAKGRGAYRFGAEEDGRYGRAGETISGYIPTHGGPAR